MSDVWQGQIILECQYKDNKTVLSKYEHVGPLMVQKVFYPEKTCHIYLLHPPGGIAFKDELNVVLKVGKSAQVLLTTPGATKFYKNESQQFKNQKSLFKQEFEIAEDGELEVLPQPNIFFKGTDTKVQTDITLDHNAKLFFRDISICGMALDKVDFDNSKFLNHINVYSYENQTHLEPNLESKTTLNKKLIFKETSRVYGNDDLFDKAVLNGNCCIGTILVSPFKNEWLETLNLFLQNMNLSVAATLLESLLVIRLIANDNEKLEQASIDIWQYLRPIVFAKKTIKPRVWAT